MSPLVQTADQEMELLRPQKRKKGRTTLPWRQFSIILFLQFVLPVLCPLMRIALLLKLIRDIGITNGDETQVGYYVGLLYSLFFVAEALTVLHWCRLSDHFGRKPVILTGLFGLSVSMYCFGLSKTFWELVISRYLNGALNGNLGVMKSMMVEITDPTNFAQAYAYMPIAWSSGGSLGPYVGGWLSNPTDRFPDIFGNWKFFKTYPYFLACAVPATYTAVAWLVTFLFLKEALPHCVPLGQIIMAKFRPNYLVKSMPSAPDSFSEIEIPGPHDENIEESGEEYETPLPLRALLVPRVFIAAGNYAAFSLVDIALRTIRPVFFATPIELGGLGLDPPQIGNILSIYGVINGLVQIFFFADLHDRFGSKAIYSTALTSTIPLTLTFPLINALARVQGLSWFVWCLVGAHLALSIVYYMGYSCLYVYIAAATPNRASLGATNGIAQVLVSIMRAIGPAATTSMFSISTKTPDLAWLVYIFLFALVCISIRASLLLPRKVWNSGGMD